MKTRVRVSFVNDCSFGGKKSSSLYTNFKLDLFIVCELNNWPQNTTNNFLLKNCYFATIELVRNRIKSKFTYNGQGIPFDGEGSWSFDKGFARNVAIFGVDNSSPFHSDN